jgi:heme-degrading monooxygenase HmoA
MADNAPFTSGRWVVKAGSEADFIAAWQELADWSRDTIGGFKFASLIQDKDEPTHFLSFGEWSDTETITKWRGHPDFPTKLGKARSLCEEFEARDYARVAGI